MKLQTTFKEALNPLHHQPYDAVRMEADRWLQVFQRTIDAWQVIPALRLPFLGFYSFLVIWLKRGFEVLIGDVQLFVLRMEVEVAG